MGRRIVKAGLAAGAALMLAGCGGGSDPAAVAGTGGAGGEAGQGDGDGGASRTASLAQPGSLTVAFCQTLESDGGGQSYQVILRSYAAKDGAFVGEHAIAMRHDAEPAAVCEGDGPSTNTAFNKDLTLVAALVNGDRAAAFDLTTGQEVGAPDPDAFTKRPDNGGVAFHPVTGRLWYDMGRVDSDATGAVASRDPKGGLKTEENTPFEKVPDLLKKDGPTAETVLATDDIHAVAVPAGGIVATYSTDNGVRLNKVGPGSGGIGAGVYLTEIAPTGLDEDNREMCVPSFWRNATTLVCEFKQLTFSADYKKLLKTEDLIPENDRINSQPVLSPDGKSFAFLSKGEDGRRSLFRGDFSGGAPVKITTVDAPVADEDNLRTTLIRWN
ncbi:PD40 domain-containing protein [Streptomyces sp. TLI_105]|uniref:PD40 domain-containing protein n=1 Tax=Streptomyces sp. TLI_105 TaxID=1881019 RepID=UPI00089C38D4|nr:PD40 domain-containing protein [Streptomyces sp. TLI_105]SED15639.1 WD40-like Beta Propeller Repeat [Streptomyces sp. TLI_105]